MYSGPPKTAPDNTAPYLPGSVVWTKGSSAVSLTTTSLGGAGKSLIVPVRPPAGKQCSTLVAEVTVLEAASVVRLGLYADSNGYPGALLDSGTFSGATTGIKTVSIAAQTTTPLMWIALKPETSSGGAVAFRALSVVIDNAVLIANTDLTITNREYTAYGADSTRNGGTLAAAFPAWSTGPGFSYSANAPRCGMVIT